MEQKCGIVILNAFAEHLDIVVPVKLQACELSNAALVIHPICVLGSQQQLVKAIAPSALCEYIRYLYIHLFIKCFTLRHYYIQLLLIHLNAKFSTSICNCQHGISARYRTGL